MPSSKTKLSGAKTRSADATQIRRLRGQRSRQQKSRAAYHHGDLPRVLIAAALELITERGIEAFSLREVARRAEISTAAPYWHFADRDALLGAVAAECAQRWLAAMRGAVEAIPPSEPLRRLQATGIAHVQFAVENPAHFRVMEIPTVRDRMPQEVRKQVATFYEEESVQLSLAQAEGLLAPWPMDLLKLATRSLVNGLAHLMISDDGQVRGLSPVQVLEVAKKVTRIMGEGLLPRR